jgi:hypothetical protein
VTTKSHKAKILLVTLRVRVGQLNVGVSILEGCPTKLIGIPNILVLVKAKVSMREILLGLSGLLVEMLLGLLLFICPWLQGLIIRAALPFTLLSGSRGK